jgi:pyruvate kinase
MPGQAAKDLGEEFGLRRWDPTGIDPLVEQLTELRTAMLELESSVEDRLKSIPADRRASGRNLLHYVGLRRFDIRELQEQLVVRGLSSLGRCESHVMDNVQSVLGILSSQATRKVESIPAEQIPVDFRRGRELLRESTIRLFGQTGRTEPLIMVTMPAEAGLDYKFVRDLLVAGMSVMRINCAHDDQTAWSAMIGNLRRAESELEQSCRVAMDLAGPKIRTGPVESGPQVIRWKPSRDEYGVVIAPARLWISPNPGGCPPENFDLAIPVSEDWWKSVEEGDVLHLRDVAGRQRKLRIVRALKEGLLAETDKTAYVTPETVVSRSSGAGKRGKSLLGRFGPIPPKEGYLVLCEGDRLVITSSDIIGHPAHHDGHGQLTSLASIGCTLPEVFASAHLGERVLLDDGKIVGVIEEASPTRLIIRITRSRATGTRLMADKGMNFPDTDLNLPALTPADIENLEFIAANADIVSYSFVRRPEDIGQLHEHLVRLGRPELGVILKIENRQAFENLPLLLLESMRLSPATGVMIARGDLAVECGWERLVEVQEEILWMAEAAHMPVIWATQVLEGLAKTGLPTRSEITDAGMGARAECVMLNKGPNIVETVRILHEILRLMQQHQVKKRSTFRRLRMAEGTM